MRKYGLCDILIEKIEELGHVPTCGGVRFFHIVKNKFQIFPWVPPAMRNPDLVPIAVKVKTVLLGDFLILRSVLCVFVRCKMVRLYWQAGKGIDADIRRLPCTAIKPGTNVVIIQPTNAGLSSIVAQMARGRAIAPAPLTTIPPPSMAGGGGVKALARPKIDNAARPTLAIDNAM